MAAIKAASAKKALQDMMKQAPFKFRAIYTDRGVRRAICATFSGSEFRNATMAKFLAEQGVRHVFAHPHSLHHTAFAERFIRTLRTKSGKISRHEKQGGWQSIKKACDTYNQQISTPTGEKPAEAVESREAQARIIDRILLRNQKSIEKAKRPKYKVNDWVRIKLNYQDDAFAKTSKPRWSSELYRIAAVKRTMPIASYQLETSDGISLPGTWTEIWLL